MTQKLACLINAQPFLAHHPDSENNEMGCMSGRRLGAFFY